MNAPYEQQFEAVRLELHLVDMIALHTSLCIARCHENDPDVTLQLSLSHLKIDRALLTFPDLQGPLRDSVKQTIRGTEKTLGLNK